MEQLRTIIKDATLGNPPTVKGKEADEFRKEIQPDIDKVEKEGGIIDIPPEWEV